MHISRMQGSFNHHLTNALKLTKIFYFFCFQVSVISVTLSLFVVSVNIFIAFHSLYTELEIHRVYYIACSLFT